MALRLAASQRLLSAATGRWATASSRAGRRWERSPRRSWCSCSTRGEPGSWRLPFRVIGAAGLVWVVAWLMAIRPRDLEIAAGRIAGAVSPRRSPARAIGRTGTTAEVEDRAERFLRRFLALVVVVIMINLCWQYFRAWMPMMLEKEYRLHAEADPVLLVGLLPGRGRRLLRRGFLVKWLAGAGWSVHRARMATFLVCSLLTALERRRRVPARLVALAGRCCWRSASARSDSFPTYYAFTQELSVRQMGKVTGVLSFVTWTSIALVQNRSAAGSTGPARTRPSCSSPA